jgi:nucleoside-diphosphate-sugar epimerase
VAITKWQMAAANLQGSNSMKRALVCGAAGFIGSHLVKRLRKEGFWVRGVDEDSAYSAAPDSEYGWGKLFSERLFWPMPEIYGIEVHVARFHNILP